MDETIEYEIQDEEIRRLGLIPTGEFQTIQRIELPDTPVRVTEHWLAEYRDSEGNLYVPDCPELQGPIFGPRLLATIGWLKSVGHLNYIKDNGKKQWIWCITAATFSVFHVATTRSREVLEKLVGTEFAGDLNLDYCSANCSFAWNYWIKAQYCWACGARGEAGQRYHERMWTAIATCRKQNRSFFSFLLESITAKLNRQDAPTLLGA